MITPFLEDLESRIDPATEDALRTAWVEFVERRFTGDIFAPQRRESCPAAIAWPKVLVNEALESEEKMILQQLGGASSQLAQATGAFMNIRANYGTSILPSLFGVEMFYMEDAQDTLPTSHPLAGGKDAIRRLLDAGIPDLYKGLGAKVFATGQRFVEMRRAYPRVEKYVHIYHPDLQGPMDVCEVLWGSGIFLDLIDEPELVRDFLNLITDTYIAFMREWDRIVPPPASPYRVHWATLHKGHIMLRDDSAMNLSPAMFDEFVRPYDARLLDAFGGGGMHFCGRGDHFIASACSIPRMHAIYMSQPHYNDMEAIYRHTVDQGVLLVSLSRDEAEKALARGRDLHGCVHCWSAAQTNRTFNHAREEARPAVAALS